MVQVIIWLFLWFGIQTEEPTKEQIELYENSAKKEWVGDEDGG